MKISQDQKILNEVIAKAWKDSAFKIELIQNPITAIEKHLGHKINLAPDKKISFVDQSDSSTIYVNIPAEPTYEDMELNEEQLDIVSGGEGTPPILQIAVNNSDSPLFGGS